MKHMHAFLADSRLAALEAALEAVGLCYPEGWPQSHPDSGSISIEEQPSHWQSSLAPAQSQSVKLISPKFFPGAFFGADVVDMMVMRLTRVAQHEARLATAMSTTTMPSDLEVLPKH